MVHENDRLKDQDFSFCEIHDLTARWAGEVIDCSFHGARIYKCHLDAITIRCDFTDAWFENFRLNLSQEELVQTMNFKKRQFRGTLEYTTLKNLDLSDFEFSNGDFSTLDVSGSCMKNAIFRNCTVPKMTEEQWKQTWNYEKGDFRQISLPRNGGKNNLNLARTVWGGTSDDENHRKQIPVLQFGPDVNLTDAVFIDCDLSESQNLTLEQVKSTWNYKNGRMSLSKWPEEILKELDEEKENEKENEK